jgi:hypothetical protein
MIATKQSIQRLSRQKYMRYKKKQITHDRHFIRIHDVHSRSRFHPDFVQRLRSASPSCLVEVLSIHHIKFTYVRVPEVLKSDGNWLSDSSCPSGPSSWQDLGLRRSLVNEQDWAVFVTSNIVLVVKMSPILNSSVSESPMLIHSLRNSFRLRGFSNPRGICQYFRPY